MKVNTDLDYSTRDYEGFRTDLIKGLQQRIPEYTDTSQTDAGIVILELLAHNLDLLSYYNDKTANEVYLDTAKERSNIINLAKMLGYTFNDGRPSQFEQVFEIVPQDTEFTIPMRYLVKTTGNSVEESLYFETDNELVIPPNCVGNEKDAEGNYLYSVPVTQGYTVKGEIVGTSDGSANQSFTLNNYPVIKDSISLVITESTGEIEEWTRVENFLNSSPKDKHFVVSISANDKGVITFGNGRSGKIPSVKLDGIEATYRVGGGEIGNVSAMTINQMEQKLAGIVQTYNPSSAIVLGVDKEDDETIKTKAKSSFKSTWGAITLADYVDIAKTYLEIIDATSVKGDTKFDVVVTILPNNYNTSTPEYLNNLRTRLLKDYEERRVLGVEVYVRFAEKVNVTPQIELHLFPQTKKEDIGNLVSSIMKAEFGENTRMLGESIHPSEIISQLMALEGVKFVTCEIPDLPEEVLPSQVLDTQNYTLSMIGGF